MEINKTDMNRGTRQRGGESKTKRWKEQDKEVERTKQRGGENKTKG